MCIIFLYFGWKCKQQAPLSVTLMVQPNPICHPPAPLPLPAHFASLLTFRLPNKLVGQEYNYQYFYQDHPTNNPTSRTQQVMSNLSST
jgi:hypothetical protein